MAVPQAVTPTLATAATEYQAAQPAAPLRILTSEPAPLWHKLDHLLYLPVLGLTRPADLYYYQGAGLQVLCGFTYKYLPLEHFLGHLTRLQLGYPLAAALSRGYSQAWYPGATPLFIFTDWHDKPLWTKLAAHSGPMSMWGRVMSGAKQLLITGTPISSRRWQRPASGAMLPSCTGGMGGCYASASHRLLSSSYAVVEVPVKPDANAIHRSNALSHRPLIGFPAASLEPSPAPPARYFQFNGNYPAGLTASGALPVVIPLGLPEDALADLFGRLDGLCLAGGVDVAPAEYNEAPHPALGNVDAPRDRTELTLTRWALEADLPILGICRGIQLLNVAAGGSLHQDIPAQLPGSQTHNFKVAESPWERPTHRVRLAEESQLAGILGTTGLMVNSFHHQAVKQPAPGFTPVAWAEDGVIEGIENPAHRFIVGVQWHPEGMFQADPLARQLFAAFVAAARG